MKHQFFRSRRVLSTEAERNEVMIAAVLIYSVVSYEFLKDEISPHLFSSTDHTKSDHKFVIRGCNHIPSSQQLFGNVKQTKLSLSFILMAIAAALDVRGAF